MSQYAIDKDLRLLRHFSPPLQRAILPMASWFLRVAPTGFDRSKIHVQPFDVNGVRCHLLSPLGSNGQLLPCLFYIHGGGFVFRAMIGHYYCEQQYVLQAGCRVVDIDYDLAPEHPFPVALNQCVAVYEHIIAHAEEWQIDTSRMAIGGDSAGASLACDTYLRLQTKVVMPKTLMLIYPVVDNLQQTESIKRFTDTPAWNSIANRTMWEYYLQGQSYRSPVLRAEELAAENVYIELCEFDCLHDEGLNLYHALQPHTSYIVLNDTRGTFHGYDINRHAAATQDALRQRTTFLQKAFYVKDRNIKKDSRVSMPIDHQRK